ncbi:MAG: hypothetical protein ACRDQI_09675 [Pseudonocardiaceae bacterium]
MILRICRDGVVLDPGWVGSRLPVHNGLAVGSTAMALFRVVGMTLRLGPGLKMTRPSIGLIRAVIVPGPVVVLGTLVIPRPVVVPRTLVIPRPVIVPRLRRVVARCVIVIEPGSLVASLGVLLMPVTGAVGEGPTQVSVRRACTSMRLGHIPQQFRGDALAASNVQVRKSFGSH